MCEYGSRTFDSGAAGLFVPIRTYGGIFCSCGSALVCGQEETCNPGACFGGVDRVLQNVFLCALSDRCFGRSNPWNGVRMVIL